MTCEHCRDALDAYVDDELSPDDRREIAEHLETCASCRAEERALSNLRDSMKAELVRYRAPDVLKARIRGAIGSGDTFALLRPTPATGRWPLAAAAAVTIAIVSSALTFAAVRGPSSEQRVAEEVVTSHIRSLMPGHLTDVVSSDLHNVKPWFNGRVDLSPAVPDLSSLGFPLVGGRLDYVSGRRVAVTTYARRQHLINVYAWPAPGAAASGEKASIVNGYHLVEWTQDGIEQWVVSDLNTPELNQFVRGFRGK